VEHFDGIDSRSIDSRASGRREQAGTALPPVEEDSGEHGFGWLEGLRIVLVLLSAIVVWFHPRAPFTRVSLIGVAGVLIGGWPIFKEAAGNILARRMTMELSMSIAIIAAAAISEFFTALIITIFVLVAEVLERMTVSRGRRAIRDLLEFLPRSVTVRRAAPSAKLLPMNFGSATACWSTRAAPCRLTASLSAVTRSSTSRA